MRLTTYVLFLILFALLGIATVVEKSAEAQIRYDMAQVLQRETTLHEDLQREQFRWARLTSPPRLAELARQPRPVPPEASSEASSTTAQVPDPQREASRR